MGFEQSGTECALLNAGYMPCNYTFHCCGINSEHFESSYVYIKGLPNLKCIYYPLGNTIEMFNFHAAMFV